MKTRPLRILLAHPGAHWSTKDVFDGLEYGLKHWGVEVFPYRLDRKLELANRALHFRYRARRRLDRDAEKPTSGDINYEASFYLLESALRRNVDVVLIVSGMFIHPDVLVYLRRAQVKVVGLFTESPYDEQGERDILATRMDGGWTTERTSVSYFRQVNPNVGYLRHGWHPERHFPRPAHKDVPAHDVVFVGSGFPERITFFNSIDWTGIDLGLYGTWKDLGLKPQVEACIKDGPVSNEAAAQLYQKSKICLNLYRVWKGWGRDALRITWAESLSPRAYELAACGVFHISDDRKEVHEVFGDLVPTFRTPTEAAALIRLYLKDESERKRKAALLPARVAGASWVNRAQTVLSDLAYLFPQTAAVTAEAS